MKTEKSITCRDKRKPFDVGEPIILNGKHRGYAVALKKVKKGWLVKYR